ncbi:MAG: ATP-binding protein [Synergistaceae bacterium]|nr:ATP-binding protein [Synergistaceae bacterium]MBQ9573770.1 ATP-binding protein [Synergistaceae bacterium]
MSDNESILIQLRRNNPFASSISPMPFENFTPDIAQLNRDASEEIEQLIRQKRREPSIPLAGLVFGAAGIGKTHMLTRILRKLRKNSWPAIFVTVRSFTNPKRVMQELLSEVMICLTKEHSGGRSQFDVIVDGMMNSYHEHRKNDGFRNIESIEPKIYLKRDMPEIDRNFLKCLLLCLSPEKDSLKYEVTEWIREGLDDEDSLRLGLPLRDINSMDDAQCESSAKNLLTSLGIVLAYSHLPMIVCFDELDSIRDKELIEAWGDTVGFLMNHLSGILPLCFVKSETWEIFKPVLNLSMLQRLRNNTIIMKGTCSPVQAKQLIHDRIAAAFKENAEEIYQWLITRMNSMITPGLSPRMVIELANKALKSDIRPENFIKEIYDEECKKIQAEPKAWPPNAESLTLALKVWLSSLDGFALKKSSGKYIRVEGTHREKRFAFIVLIPKSHITAIAGLNEGIKFLKEYKGSFCCYVLEEKSHKKTWKKFADKLKEFEDAGGLTVRLTKESRIPWYALTALINRIDNGDVNLYLDSGNRPAARNDANSFIRTLRLIDSHSVKNPSVKNSNPAHTNLSCDEKSFAAALKSIITASPMNIMNPDKASSLLAQKGIDADRNMILSFVNNHPDVFRTFRARNDTLIGLTESV